MLCPNCGTKTTTEHKFCRNCGMNLEPVARALAAHLSVGGAAPAKLARAANRRNAQKLAGGLVAGVALLLFGMLLMAFLPGKGFQLLGLVAAVLGILYSLASITPTLRRVGDAGVEPLPHALDNIAPGTGRLLHEQTFEHVPTSVADHTTELLNAELKDRKARD